MIKVKKDTDKIPASLLKANRKDAFAENVKKQCYDSSNEYYKSSDVKEALDAIYHKKCAYCEKKLWDTVRAIEHYRPKNKRDDKTTKCNNSNAYYWLAFSWDNLLLACSQCNWLKGCCFDIDGTRATYEGQAFDKVQGLAKDYHKTEKPWLLNPEIDEDDPAGLFYFEKDGTMKSKGDKRMAYTIRICGIGDREELVVLRMKELNNFKNSLLRSFGNLGRSTNIIDILMNRIGEFAEETKPENEFTAWRTYIFDHFLNFTHNPDSDDYNKVLKLAYMKYKSSQ